VPPIPESGADYAIRAVDPCRLLAGPALARYGASPPSPGGLNSCLVRVVRPDTGKRDYLKLAVGASFNRRLNTGTLAYAKPVPATMRCRPHRT
jgi:hypothetical protein